jgi:hypothetical protein
MPQVKAAAIVEILRSGTPQRLTNGVSLLYTSQLC